MDWKNFKAKTEEANEGLRAVALLLEGMDPDAEIEPIQGIEPRKCVKCRKSLPFIAAETSTVCPGGCDG